jgi:hypothetical protein
VLAEMALVLTGTALVLTGTASDYRRVSTCP